MEGATGSQCYLRRRYRCRNTQRGQGHLAQAGKEGMRGLHELRDNEEFAHDWVVWICPNLQPIR